MKRISLLLITFLCFTAYGVWGQNMPHVTNINAEIRNNLIRLTWTDSPVARGHVYIFRSPRPFSGVIPANIRPVIIRYGVQSYIDDTDDLESIFYFIAASDISGNRYNIIIPDINSINVIIAKTDETHENTEEDTPAPPQITLPEPEPIQGLSNLRAVLDGERVIITFTNTNPGRNTILYRSAQPIRRPHNLGNASIVRPHTDSQFIDYPVPGTAWYYAIVYEDEVTGGNININPGVNTTTSGILISSDLAVSRAMRPIPLPELTLSDLHGNFLTNQPRYMSLGNESIDLLRNIPLPQRESSELQRPRVFVIDMGEPESGEGSVLSQIIKDNFILFDWENSNNNLRHFLSLPRSKEVEARARFYLGQSLYFTGRYTEALMEFLLFRSYHEVEANIWINAALSAMVN